MSAPKPKIETRAVATWDTSVELADWVATIVRAGRQRPLLEALRRWRCPCARTEGRETRNNDGADDLVVGGQDYPAGVCTIVCLIALVEGTLLVPPTLMRPRRQSLNAGQRRLDAEALGTVGAIHTKGIHRGRATNHRPRS